MIARLRERVKEIGKTQKQIAEEIAISPISISAWFHGRVVIESRHITPLARALQMEPAEILEIVDWVLSHPAATDRQKEIDRAQQRAVASTSAPENVP